MEPTDAELREATRNLVSHMASAGWIQESLIRKGILHVKFTPFGLRATSELQALLHQAGRPMTVTELMSLEYLLLCSAKQRAKPA